MLTRREILSDPRRLADKARGALYGLAIGHSMGERAALSHPCHSVCSQRRNQEERIATAAEYSLLTAQALLESGGAPDSASIAGLWMEHVATLDEVHGRRSGETEAARNLRRGMLPPLTGICNAYAHAATAAARIAPVGIVCAGDVDAAMRLAEVDASVSHSREGVWGAQSVAAAVAAAMADASIQEICDVAMRPAPEGSWYRLAMGKAISIVREHDAHLDSAWKPLHDALLSGFDAAVCSTVPQSLGVLMLVHQDFKRGVTAAANFGRDGAIIAALCGAILGARYGAGKIPAAWQEANRFAQGACLPFTRGMDRTAVAQSLAQLALDR